MFDLTPLQDLAILYIEIFGIDVIRYFLFAGGVYLLVSVLFHRAMQQRKIRPATPPDGQIWREILASLRTAAVFGANGTVIVLFAKANVITIYPEISDYGWAYLIFSTAVLVVAHDAWFYWSHKLLHYPPLFRKLHKLHHRSHNPTAFAAYSFDLGEAVINAAYLPVALLMIPTHPIALFVFVTHMILRNAMGHSGYELFPANRSGKPLMDWMTTVTHHDQHHAHAGYNLGLYFTWWDRLMGTEHPSYHAEFATVSRPVSGRNLKVIALAILIALGASASRGQAETLSGTFAAPGMGVIVAFGPCTAKPSQSCGVLVWSWDQSATPYSHPGDVIINNLEWDGASWIDGRLTNPENGRTYRGSITPEGPNSLRLRGCAGPFCATQVWHSTKSLMAILRREG